MAPSLAMWLLLPLICGCLAVPSEIELTVELGAEQAEVQATLRDIQLWTEDPVEALRIFHNVHAPDALHGVDPEGTCPSAAVQAPAGHPSAVSLKETLRAARIPASLGAA